MKNKKRNYLNRPTKHHLIPRSKENKGFITSHPLNIKILVARTHEALHNLFVNRTPREQLLFITQLNQNVLNKSIVEELLRILDEPDKKFYKSYLIKRQGK